MNALHLLYSSETWSYNQCTNHYYRHCAFFCYLLRYDTWNKSDVMGVSSHCVRHDVSLCSAAVNYHNKGAPVVIISSIDTVTDFF